MIKLKNDLMMRYINKFSFTIKGFIGIFTNKNLNLKTKINLFYDDLRVLRRLFNYLILKKNVTFFEIKAFNLKISFDDLFIFFHSFTEIFCLSHYPIKKNLSLYIDAGANIGLAILYYRIFNPQMKIIAFEPDENFFRFLERNLKQNQVQNYQIYKIALCNKKGKARFYHLNDKIQALKSGLFPSQKWPFKESKVKTDRLSHYISGPVSLLKMDVEGSEYDVLEDLFSSGKLRLIETIVFEAHHFNQPQKEKFKSTCQKLNKTGKVQVRSSKETSLVVYERPQSGRGSSS